MASFLMLVCTSKTLLRSFLPTPNSRVLAPTSQLPAQPRLDSRMMSMWRSPMLAVVLLLCIMLQLVQGAAIPTVPETAVAPSGHRTSHAQAQGLLGLLTHTSLSPPAAPVPVSFEASSKAEHHGVADVDDMTKRSGRREASSLEWKMSTDDRKEEQPSRKRGRRPRYHP